MRRRVYGVQRVCAAWAFPRASWCLFSSTVRGAAGQRGVDRFLRDGEKVVESRLGRRTGGDFRGYDLLGFRLFTLLLLLLRNSPLLNYRCI